jgi:hypothetical protein
MPEADVVFLPLVLRCSELLSRLESLSLLTQLGMRVAAPLTLRAGDREKLAKLAASRAGDAGLARARPDRAAGRGRVVRTLQWMGYGGTTLAIYDEAPRKGDLLLPVPGAPKDRSSIAALLQRHGVHDLGYIGPGTSEQFPILDRADTDLPGTAHCFGGPYVQDRAPFPSHAPSGGQTRRSTVMHGAAGTAVDLATTGTRPTTAPSGPVRCKEMPAGILEPLADHAPAGPRRILGGRTGRSRGARWLSTT